MLHDPENWRRRQQETEERLARLLLRRLLGQTILFLLGLLAVCELARFLK